MTKNQNIMYIFVIYLLFNMKFNYSLISLSIAFSTALFSCGVTHKGDNDQINKEVDDFATSYFNYNYKEAIRHCTPESRKWLIYAASNIHDADIIILKNSKEGASIVINDYEFHDNDTTGYALITVHNYMQLDTIGKAGRIIKQADFRLPVVLRNKRWTIKMEAPLRSEKPNRD